MTMEKTDKKAEALRRLFAMSRDAVLGIRDERVVFANQAAGELFGRDVTGERTAALLPESFSAPEEDSFVTAVSLGGTVYTVTAVREDGILILTIPRPEQGAGAAGIAALSRMRMAAFRLRISLDALASGAPGGEANGAYHSYYALLHLIEELSDVDAVSRGELLCRMETLDLGRLAGSLVDSVSAFVKDRGTAVECSLPEERCFVRGDRERLEQLLLIVLSNALLHTGPEGRVRVALRREGRQYILCVDDNGEGMGPGELAYAFSLRETAPIASAASGAGMGLYIAQAIARLHGGAMVLRSEPGKGTRVRVTLPVFEGVTVGDAGADPARGPELILKELANVLSKEAYDRKYRD